MCELKGELMELMRTWVSIKVQSIRNSETPTGSGAQGSFHGLPGDYEVSEGDPRDLAKRS